MSNSIIFPLNYITRHIQNPFKYLMNDGPFYSEFCITMMYSQPQYIQNPGIFRTRGIFRTLSNICDGAFYPEPCVNLAYLNIQYIENPGTFRTRGTLRTLSSISSMIDRFVQNPVKPWHIQNPGIFRTLAYSEPVAHSEPCQTSTMELFAKMINSYNCLRSIFIQFI